ncbi:MAG: Gfo/Idh/MocA family oxidoreductase, partial [Gammaproteobacteria bacterium]
LQPEVATAALAAGKHVLTQKPMAMEFAAAQRLVQAAQDSGRLLAVNQNGRFDPSINAARSLIRQGLLGERVACSMRMNITMPWQAYYRDPKYDRLMMLHMSVHHLDQFRWMFGTPESIYAAARRVPGDGYYGENYATYVLHYADGFLASSVEDGSDWSSDFGISYRISGTEAILVGEIGWPHNRKSTLRYELRAKPGVWHELHFSRSWFPDAFSGTMGELMSAIEQSRVPFNSGADNLQTMRTVFAAYRSVEAGRSVSLAEIG